MTQGRFGCVCLSKQRTRRAFIVAGALALLVPIYVYGAFEWVTRSSAPFAYESLRQVPRRPIALVLGCSSHLPDGRRNLYFLSRIKAAAELYHGGRVDMLLVSGDNGRLGYDEPTDMRNALVKAGVPSFAIVRDYAGFRTSDSVLRAQKIFGVNKVTIVSQPFHAARALYIARRQGMDAVAYHAQKIGGLAQTRTLAREHLSRAIMLFEVHVWGVRPRYLGPKKPIALSGRGLSSAYQ